MKKITAILISVVLLILSLSVLSACGKNKTVAFDSKMLKDYKVNLNNSASLGIANKSSVTGTSANVSASVRNASQDEEKRNYLVSIDNNDNVQDVVFYKGNKQLAQNQIPAQIDKLKVTKDFTYISFTTKEIDPNVRIKDNLYDNRDYLCDKTTQSFVIHNETGKIYSLAEISDNIVYLYRNIIRESNDKLYILSIENGNLIATNPIKNPNLNVSNLSIDKYGTIFIINTLADEVSDNCVYLYSDIGHSFLDGKFHCMSPDGIMYYFEESGDLVYGSHIREKIKVKQFDANKTLVDVPENATVYFNLWPELYIIKNDYLLYSPMIGQCIQLALKNEDGDFVHKELEIVDNARFYFANGEAYSFDHINKTLYHYTVNISGSNYSLSKTNILTCSEVLEGEDYIYAYQEGVTGLKKYKIYVQNGNVVTELVNNLIFGETEIIVVQPLN